MRLHIPSRQQLKSSTMLIYSFKTTRHPITNENKYFLKSYTCTYSMELSVLDKPFRISISFSRTRELVFSYPHHNSILGQCRSFLKYRKYLFTTVTEKISMYYKEMKVIPLTNIIEKVIS